MISMFFSVAVAGSIGTQNEFHTQNHQQHQVPLSLESKESLSDILSSFKESKSGNPGQPINKFEWLHNHEEYCKTDEINEREWYNKVKKKLFGKSYKGRTRCALKPFCKYIDGGCVPMHCEDFKLRCLMMTGHEIYRCELENGKCKNPIDSVYIMKKIKEDVKKLPHKALKKVTNIFEKIKNGST